MSLRPGTIVPAEPVESGTNSIVWMKEEKKLSKCGKPSFVCKDPGYTAGVF